MTYRRYVGEFNRARGDSIRIAARRLSRLGLYVEVLSHKTSLLIDRPMSMSWDDFKRALRSVLDPYRGSLLLFSQATGNTFICSNRGNQPGVFQRLERL